MKKIFSILIFSMSLSAAYAQGSMEAALKQQKAMSASLIQSGFSERTVQDIEGIAYAITIYQVCGDSYYRLTDIGGLISAAAQSGGVPDRMISDKSAQMSNMLSGVIKGNDGLALQYCRHAKQLLEETKK